MISRSILAWLSLLLVASSTLAAGTYQLTKEGATYVWNNYPRPGDEATWSGAKDNEGYATGEGVVTWSKRGKFMTRYWGRMIRGKLEGPVMNEDASGKKFRGTFINGVKSGDWAAVTDFPANPNYTDREPLGDFLNRKDAEITAAYRACLAAFRDSAAKESLRIAQRAWIVFSNKNEAAAELAGARRGLTREELIREAAGEVEARTEQLRTFFNLPAQDLGACRRDWDAAERDLTAVYNQVLAMLASDEQDRLRDAERAWVEFREKSATSHRGDTSGRASIWDRVVIDRRRTQELRDFYLNRISGRAPGSSPSTESSQSPALSSEGKFSQLVPDTSAAARITPLPTPVTTPMAAPSINPADIAVRARIILDFKDDVKALFTNVSNGAAFKQFASLKEIIPLPTSTSEAITKGAERAREFRSKIGYAESLRECGAETALIDALVAYDQSIRALHSGDGPMAQTTISSFLRDHGQAPAQDYNAVWASLGSLNLVFKDASNDASRHLEEAQQLVTADKTTEAIKKYELANTVFPDPKIARTVKRLKEESLGL
jgi:uncharacterized protein YecT (DUF1311 family)